MWLLFLITLNNRTFHPISQVIDACDILDLDILDRKKDGYGVLSEDGYFFPCHSPQHALKAKRSAKYGPLTIVRFSFGRI